MATALIQRLRTGIAAVQAGEFDRARALLQPVADASPDDPLAWFWLAIAAPSAEAAIDCLRRVLQIDDGHVPARDALVRLLITQAGTAATAGNRREAHAYAGEAVQLAPETEAAWLALASVTNDRGERLEALQRAYGLNPDPATRARLRQALLHQAVMVAHTDRDTAKALFQEAAALDATDLHVWQALLQLAETPAEALDVVRDMVRLVPGHPEGQLLLKKALVSDARALQASDEADAALARWREASEVDPDDVEVWLGLYEAASDEDEKRRAIETAFEINPSDERVESGMEEFRKMTVDPATVAPPVDAFARLAQTTDMFATLEATTDAFAGFDLAADPFARFAGSSKPKAARPSPPEAPAVEAQAPRVEAEAPVAEPIEAEAAPSWEAASASSTPGLAELSLPDLAAVDLAVEPVAAHPDPGVLTPPPIAAEPVAAEPAVAEATLAEPTVPEPMVAPPAPAPAIAAAPRPVEPPVPVPPAPAAAAPSSNGGRRTVMVVDDSPTIRKILGLTLERAGYKVVAEPDGESAVERLSQVLPDVILLDIAMPKMDGYEACKRIKKDPRTARVPVIMLSGKDALFDKVKGHMAGATEYLTKPFEPPAVLAAVSSACQPGVEVVDG